jgi:7-keto-8-aminopelargonate synthetase-like enzyme
MVTDMSAWREELEARLAAWRAAGLERHMRVAAGRGVHLVADGRPILSFASNDYLGLSSDPRVTAAARAALEASGAGATASRLLCGTRPEHARLEEALARFKRSEAALVFASGYHTALAALTTLAGGEVGQVGNSPYGSGECAVILDRLAHACLIDGARLSGARVRTFKHNDPADLGRALARETATPPNPLLYEEGETASGALRRPAPLRMRGGRGESEPKTAKPRRALVVIESLYSMDGDVAPVAEIHAAARAAGAWLLVDEAHATGVLGVGGRGVLGDVFPGPLPEDVLAMGTLSKALGSQGGFLCASRLVVETLVQSARAFLFTTGLAPAAAAAALRALELVEEGEERRLRLLARAGGLRARLRSQGWRVLGGPGPILPVLVGDEAQAVALSERLWEEGLWAPAVRYPTVKKGSARLRISLSAEHTEEDAARLASALGSPAPGAG